MPFLYPEAGESGPIARAQAVSTPNVLCQPSSGTPDSSFHTTNSPAHPPRAHKLRFFDVRGPEYGPYSPWRFRLVDQQPASGLLDLGILVTSSAILALAMLEPKYSVVSRLLCCLRALREPEPVTMQQRPRPTPDCDGARPKQSCRLHRAPSSSLHGTSRVPTKKNMGVTTANSAGRLLPCAPPKILKWAAVKIQLPVSCKNPWSSAPFASPITKSPSTSTSTSGCWC